jgi:hypothetical protein
MLNQGKKAQNRDMAKVSKREKMQVIGPYRTVGAYIRAFERLLNRLRKESLKKGHHA